MKYLTKNRLYNLYIIKKLGTPQIAIRFKCEPITINRYLKKFKIKIRSPKEAGKNKVTLKFRNLISDIKKKQHIIPSNCFKKGHIPYNKGKSHSLETKNKISFSRKNNFKNKIYKKYHIKCLQDGLNIIKILN